MTWKPISEYPTDEDGNGPAVLVRTYDKMPYVVVKQGGKFHTIPGVPTWYGERQFGFMYMTDSYLEKFMEIPE